MSERTVTACLLIIGNEILSGRTKDANLAFLGEQLNDLGIRLMEARVIPDVEEVIVATVKAVRDAHDYVFTTGGIGPTHDDITAGCVAKAFGLPLTLHPEAHALLLAHYPPGHLNEARLRMAHTPEGATLIENPVSTAPGFRIGNVFVMAGIPRVMQAMFESLKPQLVGGQPLRSLSVEVTLPEGTLARGLGDLQDRHDDVEVGSYPFFRDGKPGVRVVLRTADQERLELAGEDLRRVIAELGGGVVAETRS